MVDPAGNVLPVVAFNGKKVDPGGKVLSAVLFGGGRKEISTDDGWYVINGFFVLG